MTEKDFFFTSLTIRMKALTKVQTLGASVMYIVHTWQYAYTDKCMSIRGSIRKFGKDKSSEK